MSDFTNPRFPERREFIPDEESAFLLIPPVANYNVSVVGNTGIFQSTAFDPDGTIVAYHWDFGDAVVRPVARFTQNVNGLVVSFIDQSTDTAPGTVVGWSWNFGDGTTSTLQNPVKTYAAGGVYTVRLIVTDNDGNQSLIAAQRTITVAATGATGRFFGPSNAFASNSALKTYAQIFTGFRDNTTASNIVARLAFAKSKGFKFTPNITGGAHTLYLVNGKFDFNTWKGYIDLYKTPAIYAAVEEALDGGWLEGASMVDEPPNVTWGPGGFNKPLIDQMAVYARAAFAPAGYFPMGVVCRYDWYETVAYQQLDWVNMQYSFRLPQANTNFAGVFQAKDPGNVDAYIARGLAQANFDGVVPAFGMNVLGGGYRYPEDPRITTKSCPIPPTGGIGENFDTSGNCRMTGPQLEDYGKKLIAAGAHCTMWWYEDAFFSKAENITAFNNVMAYAAGLPKISLRRP